MAAKDLYEKDFYKVLGVDKKAAADEIKRKYRGLVKDLHPDTNHGDSAKEEKFKAVSEAYEILSDPKKRAEYDEARSLFERGGFRAPGGGGNFQGGDFSDIFGGGNPQDFLFCARSLRFFIEPAGNSPRRSASRRSSRPSSASSGS